ncbi:MAG: SEC-C metal-binding domain-containing protein [Patescibacteria group bacterium]
MWKNCRKNRGDGSGKKYKKCHGRSEY